MCVWINIELMVLYIIDTLLITVGKFSLHHSFTLSREEQAGCKDLFQHPGVKGLVQGPTGVPRLRLKLMTF